MATREENGSFTYLHPGLKLREPSEADKNRCDAWNKWMDKFHEAMRERQARGPATGRNLISQLPVQILGRILRSLLVFDGRPVHVISRLDPYQEPDPGLHNRDESVQTDRNGAGLQLLNRFHIGNESLSLACARPPQVLLAPLSVCKQWNYIGGNLFYSLNHFCFSSLLWIGNQEVCHAANERGMYRSRRTQPLMYLPETIRLKHIEIYIRESDPFYMRRKHEPRGTIRFLKKHTITQPDFRLFRDMKTIQGVDYISCLRGLSSIRLYDYDFYIKNGETKGLRNHTFVGLLNEVTTRQKAPEKERLARFENLAPLCGYIPAKDERDWVERAITIGDEPEDEPESEPDEDEDDDPPSGPDDQHGLTPGFNGGNGEDDNDDSDDSDADRGHNRRPHRQHGRNFPRRAAPPADSALVAGPDDDDNDDNDDDDELMPDAPQLGDLGDEEMSDAEHGDDVDTAMVDTNLNRTTHIHGSSYNADADADADAPLPSPRAAGRSQSSDLFVESHGSSSSGPSPGRHTTPGLATQGSYRFTPSVDRDSEDAEGSLFVHSDRNDTPPIKFEVEDGTGAEESCRSAQQQQTPGPAHVAQRLPKQAWENASSSDLEDGNDDDGEE
ncbi:hypothetical protein BBO_05043 [Beauveria brongniartii RCEF 3172]|uniref:Uncharacterized protein n=1 Tax=Beauveria brongniartii RCEF 3172 TaxID=1081107 RepID=A0A167DGW2_9HYPO|nr:hypothetical protein BBO_05043 [Beauveria brongniartii RCEF 3172]